MVATAFTVFVALTITFITLSAFFLQSVKQEAPTLFESWGRPSVGRYLWRRQLFMPYSRLVLFRRYPQELATHRKSRAWASWLFIVHWLQLVAAIVVFATILGA